MKNFSCLVKVKVWLLLVSLFFAVGVEASNFADSRGSAPDSPLEAYGILLFDKGAEVNRIVSFQIPFAGDFSMLRSLGSTYVSAAACVEGKYYLATVGMLSNAAEELKVFDMETGELSSVGMFSGFSKKIADMSYDYSSGTLYAVSGDISAGSGSLYAVDPATAAVRKAADLSDFFFALACSYGGQLYGISKYGDFCKIDKATGAVEMVGYTGYNPTGDSSLEFNHTDKSLYWTVNTVDDQSLLCRIDVKTGSATVVSQLGTEADASVAGLYIPFAASADDTPSAVENLAVTADPQGACKATLTWTNPSTLFGGGVLEALERVDIYRNGDLIVSKTGMQPGAEASYEDVIAGTTGLFAAYKIVPVNENGEGVSSELSLFVGEDVPAAPANVRLQKTASDAVVVSWDAPEKGVNGGWIDRNGISYSVVRQPGDEVLADNCTATEYEDSGVASVGSYTYEITAVTKAGVGEKAVSGIVVLGPGNSLPYECGFETEEQTASWTVINADGDDRKWVHSTYNGGAMVFNGGYNTADPADDWLVSHDFSLEAGKTYKGTFAGRALKAQKLKVCLGQGIGVTDMNTVLADYPDIEAGSDFVVYEYSFTVEKSGLYNIGFHLYSDGSSSYFYLTDVTLEQRAETNLQLSGLEGPKTLVAGNSYVYKATVVNKGANPVASCKVVLKDADKGTELASASCGQTIESGAEIEVKLSWKPAKEGELNVVAEVSCAGDEIAADNTSASVAVSVLPEGSPDRLEIGSVDDSCFDRYSLFNVYNKNSAALNIYSSEDIGKEEGVIESLAFTAKNGNSYDVEDTPVKIYLANTELSTANYETGWIPEEEMTLVYDGTLTIPQGVNELTLPLDRKFELLKGKNLAVLTTHEVESGYYNSVTFPYFPTADNTATYYYYSDYTQFDFTNSGNAAWQQKAAITLVMRCTGATVSGIVSDDKGQTLAGAELVLEERAVSVVSDENGAYSFRFVPDGSYTLKVSMKGYPEREYPVSVVDGADVKQDVMVTNLPTYSVSGVVLSVAGDPVADAKVVLSGYDTKETETSADGRFVFTDVFAVEEPYGLSVSCEWFERSVQEISVTDSDVELDGIRLEYLKYTPVNAAVRIDGSDENTLTVDWENAASLTELRTEGGLVGGNAGISNATGTTVLGTIYREPMALEELDWYLTQAGGPHTYAVLYVFALDKDGNPTNTVLFSSTEKNTDNYWNSFKLPETVYAPNGCVVALGYSGYLGVGTDSGRDIAYPFAERTHVFAADYSNGEFEFVESRGIRKNLMIRAKGRRLADNGDESSALAEGSRFPEFCAYKVWRFSQQQASDPESWTLVTPEAVKEMKVTENVGQLPSGIYGYAVRTVYPDGSVSDAARTPLFAHDMRTKAVVRVKSNSKGEGAQGAVVTLTGKERGESATAVVDAQGNASFGSLWKDKYEGSISLAGYETVAVSADFSVENEYQTDYYLLKEQIVKPVNLAIEETESPEEVLFTWNTSGTIFEDFESHEDFAVNSPGEIGWSYIDGDDDYTYGFENADFPSMSGKMSYVVFNPEMTTPSVGGVEELKPYSGSKYLAGFASLSQNDDYLVSPVLSYAHDFAFSFFVSSYAQYAGLPDRFSVGYSEVENPAADDFKWLEENVSPVTGWNEYSYTVPQSAKHVAIRNASDSNGFILMLDDIYIGSRPRQLDGRRAEAAPVQKPDVSYEVYLDGKLVATTDAISHRFAGLAPGRHKAGVRAVYFSGSSEVVSIEFGEDSGIGSACSDGLRIYPNPTSEWLTVEGRYTGLQLMSLSGTVIRSYEGVQERLDFSDLPAGVYLLAVVDAERQTRQIKKVTVVR